MPPEGPTGPIVRSLGLGMPSGSRLDPHAHDWHQLVAATDGVMTVEAQGGHWVVPPQRAVWIPAGVRHAVRMTGAVRMRTLYLHPDLPGIPGPTCCVLTVTPLLRELLLEVLRRGMLHGGESADERLAGVLVDQLSATPAAALELPLPRDDRALRVARRVLADPASTAPLADLCQRSGASPRTVERLFVRETGLTFGRWVQRVKALAALERLAAGDSVTQAGLAVGYDSTSAFIAMFKRVVGTTPARSVPRVPARPR